MTRTYLVEQTPRIWLRQAAGGVPLGGSHV